MKLVTIIISLSLFWGLIMGKEPENLHFLSDTAGYKVRLFVFSGTEDPTWTIESASFAQLKQLVLNNKFREKKTTRVMGYKGFMVTPLDNNEMSLHVRGNPQAEMFLLDAIKDKLKVQVYEHILEQISISYEMTDHKSANIYHYNSGSFVNYNCNATPVRGPDTIPNFNPTTDDFGCFEDKQYDNNCYNYGNDIVTNTFAQPGRGTEHKWQENTCEDVKRAALSDGLVWIGTDYPSDKPSIGHYIALLIWPSTNFHWIRLDSNGQWSHKPGGTEIRDTDNDGGKVHDPSTQDFSPWSQFCGYFLTLPSKVNIN